MILAIDTSLGTSVALVALDGSPLAERTSRDPRGHAEAIGTFIAEVLAEAGVEPSEVTAVAAGMGPGAYTGLRVGIAAARAFAIGRGIPVLPIPSHDAIREELDVGEDVPIATPAGRRGHYLSHRGTLRLTHDEVGDEVVIVESFAAAAVARLALRRLAAGEPTGPEQPLYLREPDVAVPAARKRVS